MPQPVAFNTGSSISGSIQSSRISYAIETSGSNYRGGYAGKTWYSELPATTGVVFIKDTTAIGRGTPGNPAFWITNGTSSAAILTTVNGLPGSPRNFTTTQSAYSWSLANGFFINDPNEPFNQIDTDSLALYLDASKTVSYPTTASTWYDISGNNRNGSLLNGPTYNTNGYITFDGVDDVCNFPIRTFNTGSPQQGTFSILMKFPTLNIASSTQIFYDGGASNNLIYLYRNSNFPTNQYGWLIYYTGSTGDGFYLQQPTYLPGIWYDTTFTFDNTGRGSIYRNGELVNSSIPSNGGTFISWKRTGNNTPSINPASAVGTGSIQSFKWYNRALSQTEILQNYYQAPIVTDGLVLAVDAGNIVSYESGSSLSYSLTGSLSGSLVNGTSYSTINGGTWVFDGINDYINFGNVPSVTLTGSSVSLEAWVNYNLSQEDWKGIIYKADGNSTGYQLFIDSAERVAFGVITTSGFSRPNAGFTLSANAWHHVVGSYDGSNMRIYVDGILYNTTAQSGSILASTTNLFVGMSFASEELPGYIPVARIYNKGLTTQEVLQNFNAQRNRFNI